MRSPLAVRPSLPKVAGHLASTFVRQAGAIVVDRLDRKLINDASAALRIEDRLLSVPVALPQLESRWVVLASRPGTLPMISPI